MEVYGQARLTSRQIIYDLESSYSVTPIRIEILHKPPGHILAVKLSAGDEGLGNTYHHLGVVGVCIDLEL